MRALPLLALVLLLPVASACSFASEPPRPATFTLVPHDGSPSTVLEVDGRMSGGDCGLSNPFAFSNGSFAWIEYEWNPNRRIGVIVDLATMEEQRIELRGEHIDGSGLWNGKLLYREIQYHESAPDASGHRQITTESTFFLHDVATGVADTLPLPGDRWGQVLFDGPRVVGIQRDPTPGGAMTLTVYDIEQGEIVIDGRAMDGFSSSSGFAAVTAAGDGWIAIEGDGQHLYDLATGETRTVARGRVGAIVDGYAYLWQEWGSDPLRMRLPDGEQEPFPVKGPILGFIEGHTVVGQYSPPLATPVPPVHDRPLEAFDTPGVPIFLRAALFLFAGPLGGLLSAFFGMM